MRGLGLGQSEEASLSILTSEVLKTSEIEGELLDADTVRSSLARRLGIEAGAVAPQDRRVDGVVDMVLDASGSMQVVSGPLGREKGHYKAPPAEFVPKEMSIFLNWFNQNQDLDPFVKSALAHLWFVTIHPFEDGNGRIGRAVCDMVLAQSEQSAQRFYSLSAQIRKERKNYYNLLERTQRDSLEVTAWLEWFLETLLGAFKGAEESLK